MKIIEAMIYAKATIETRIQLRPSELCADAQWKDSMGVIDNYDQLSASFSHAGRDVRVKERTGELTVAHKELLKASRRAGMAEVATSVLHNVGNVLNSVNISLGVATEKMSRSKSWV